MNMHDQEDNDMTLYTARYRDYMFNTLKSYDMTLYTSHQQGPLSVINPKQELLKVINPLVNQYGLEVFPRKKVTYNFAYWKNSENAKANASILISTAQDIKALM